MKERKKTLRFWYAREGIAIPVTFLMLFVSLTFLITATYYFSINRLTAKSQELKVSGVEQEMLSFEKVVKFVTWSPGTYETFEFGDFGGAFKVLPTSKRLMLNLTDNSSFAQVFFNSSVGEIVYELPPSEAQDNMFLKGDSRVIVNESSATMTQVQISQGSAHYEITLAYRPLASSTVTDSSSEKPTNNLRIYIINLNSSESVTRMGSLRLKATCVNVTSSWLSYDFPNAITSLMVKADVDGNFGTVSLPISSGAQGALVNLETVICTVKIEEVGG
jgi:hypothetical protein